MCFEHYIRPSDTKNVLKPWFCSRSLTFSWIQVCALLHQHSGSAPVVTRRMFSFWDEKFSLFLLKKEMNQFLIYVSVFLWKVNPWVALSLFKRIQMNLKSFGLWPLVLYMHHVFWIFNFSVTFLCRYTCIALSPAHNWASCLSILSCYSHGALSWKGEKLNFIPKASLQVTSSTFFLWICFSANNFPRWLMTTALQFVVTWQKIRHFAVDLRVNPWISLYNQSFLRVTSFFSCDIYHSFGEKRSAVFEWGVSW